MNFQHQTKPQKSGKPISNEALLLREYLQSFLKWLYNQNDEFATTLNDEEITNYLLNELNHPVWFKYLLKNEPFHLIVEANQYISEYKTHADCLRSSIKIKPKKELAYTDTKEVGLKMPATKSQITYLVSLNKKLSQPYEETDFESLSKKEASCMIQYLVKEQESYAK